MIPKKLISTILFILTIIGIFYLWIPKYEKIVILGQQIKEVEINIQNKENYFSKLADTDKDLEKYSLFINKVDTALPNNMLILDLLKFLETKSSQSGIILKDFRIEKISSLKEPEIHELSVNISLSGTYSAFKSFISELQYNERLIEITSLSLNNIENQKQLENYNSTLTIKVYSY